MNDNDEKPKRKNDDPLRHVYQAYDQLEDTLRLYAELASAREPDVEALEQAAAMIAHLWRVIIVNITPHHTVIEWRSYRRVQQLQAQTILARHISPVFPFLERRDTDTP